MGIRGPAPTPTAILELRGSRQPALYRTGEPKPERGAPKAPKGLNPAERAVWRQVCAMLDDMGVLTVVDGAQLERYCAYLVQWRAAHEFINQNGTTYPVRSASPNPTEFVGRLPDGGYVVRFAEYPQVWQARALDRMLKEIEAQFGLTPAARTRLKAEAAADARPDSISAFARKRQA